MLNFVAMDGPHDAGAVFIARLAEPAFEFQRMVEVSAFECQREPGHVIEQRLEFLGFVPEITVDGDVAEFHAPVRPNVRGAIACAAVRRP